MKILQIFGAVAALHLLAFIFIFASPGCQSSPGNVPTPDATLPGGLGTASATNVTAPPPEVVTMPDTGAPSGYVPPAVPGRAEPTRPGSPNAAAITPVVSTAEGVAPVTTYTIRKGDSLWLIAKKNHITVSELTKANNIGSSASLQPGKKLIIPGKIAPAAAPAQDTSRAYSPAVTAPVTEPKVAPARSSAEVVRHTVAPGESLGIIAHKYGLSTGELAAANSISDPTHIRVGQQLVIPNAKSGARSSMKSTPKPAAASAADKPAAPAPKPAPDQTPHFEIKPPPPGQDLDAGLKDATATEVPTVKVEEPKPDDTPKN